jgi:hypothetical protein
MKKVLLVSGLLCLVIGTVSFCQTVGRKPPKVILKEYSVKEEDGRLEFEVDVRMADCISYIEIKNKDSKKPLQVQVNENDYYLDEQNGQEIFLRLSLGSLKQLLRKRETLDASLVIYSKSGKPIYTNQLSLNRSELIRTASPGGQL